MDHKNLIDEVYIEEYIINEGKVNLQKRGANYVGKCPFHEEKTSSFTVSPSKQIYKCFGCGKGGNIVDYVMEREKIDYLPAINTIAAYAGKELQAPQKPLFDYERLPAKEAPDEEWTFDIKEHISNEELAQLGLNIHRDALNPFKLVSLNSYTKVKYADRATKKVDSVHVFKATEQYPMYLYNELGLRKLYVPKSQDKSRRFMMIDKPSKENKWHGLKYLIEYRETALQELKDCAEEGLERADVLNLLSEDVKREFHITIGKNKVNLKFKHLIIASGGSDAINIHNLYFKNAHNPSPEPFFSIFGNSESASVTKGDMKHFKEIAETIYVCYDNDITGVENAAKICLEYWDLRNIEIPSFVNNVIDKRYMKPCNDAKDYIVEQPRHKGWPHFKQLVFDAVPLCPVDVKYMPKAKRYDYKANPKHIAKLMTAMGFRKVEHEMIPEEYEFVRIKGKVVTKLNGYRVIREHVINDYLRYKEIPDYFNKTEIENKLTTRTFNKELCLELPTIQLADKHYTQYSQSMAFTNSYVTVGRNGFEVKNINSIEKYIFNENIKDAEITKEFLMPKGKLLMSVSQQSNGKHNLNGDMDELRKCAIFEYLYQTSRYYWRKEDEQKIPLTDDEKYEQELGLIAKLYSLGYVLHQYRDRERPWIWVGYDANNDEASAKGGSGKSFFPNQLCEKLIKVELGPGKADNTIFTDKHWLEGADKSTDALVLDDVQEYLNLVKLYSMASDYAKINPKGKKQITIKFDDLFKIMITTNYGLRDMFDPSSHRRLLMVGFSDYFHSNPDGSYNEERTLGDIKGYPIFSSEEWKNNKLNDMRMYRTALYALYIYLNSEKAIRGNTSRFELKTKETILGESFMDFATSHLEGFENVYLCRKRLHKIAEKEGVKDAAKKFKEKCHLWANRQGLVFNPIELHNNDNRIKRKFRAFNLNNPYDLLNNEQRSEAFIFCTPEYLTYWHKQKDKGESIMEPEQWNEIYGKKEGDDDNPEGKSTALAIADAVIPPKNDGTKAPF